MPFRTAASRLWPGSAEPGPGPGRRGQRGQMLGQGGGGQGAQRDGAHRRQPLQLGQERAERMAPVQVIGAVRADDRDPLGAQHPGQERQQVPRGGVRPVQVLEHDQHGGVGPKLGQQPQDRAEHLLTGHADALPGGGGGRPALRQQAAEQRTAGEGTGQPRRGPGRPGGAAQRVRERQVGDAFAELGAVPGQYGEPLPGGQAGHLGHEPGLAHSGVPADEGDDRVAGRGVVQEREQAGELGVPPDQPSPRRLRQHAPSIPSGPGNPEGLTGRARSFL